MAFSTNKSLLSKVKAGDEVGWHEFYRAYAPLIRLRAGDFGLDEDARQDLVQEVCLAVFRGSGKFVYDRSRGRFRDYLRTIIERRIHDHLRARYREPAKEPIPEGHEHDARFADPGGTLDAAWDAEWRQHTLRQALVEVKGRIEPRTFQAFELYAIRGWTPGKVADFLGMSVNSVYVAKTRALEKLKETVRQLEESGK